MTGHEATDALVSDFEARTLERAQWTHAAHLTVALAYVRVHGREEATRRIRTNIRAYNAAVGSPAGAYHETVTRAWIALIAKFLAERDREGEVSFDELLGALFARFAKKDHLLTHYSRELLFSNLARAEWVPPDLVKLG